MKKVCIFIGGVVTGAILVVVVSMLIAGGNSTYKGITLFEKEGECISENSFKVFQVLDSGEALANEVKQGYLIPVTIKGNMESIMVRSTFLWYVMEMGIGHTYTKEICFVSIQGNNR